MSTPIAQVAANVCSSWSCFELAEFVHDLGYQDYADAVKNGDIDGTAFSEILALDGLADLGIVNKVHIGRIYGRLRQLGKNVSGTAGKSDDAPWETVDDNGHKYIDVARAPLAALHSSVAAKRRARLLHNVIEKAWHTVSTTIPKTIQIRPFISTEEDRRLPNKGFCSAIGLDCGDIHDAPTFQTFPLTDRDGANIVVDIQKCGSIYNPGAQIRLRIESIRQDVFAKALEDLSVRDGRVTIRKGKEGIVVKPRFRNAAGEEQIGVKFEYGQIDVQPHQVEISGPGPSTGEHAIGNGSTFQVLGGSITFSSRGKENIYFVGSPPMEASPGVLVPWRAAFSRDGGEDDVFDTSRPITCEMLAKLQLQFINAKVDTRTTDERARKRARVEAHAGGASGGA